MELSILCEPSNPPNVSFNEILNRALKKGISLPDRAPILDKTEF